MFSSIRLLGSRQSIRLIHSSVATQGGGHGTFQHKNTPYNNEQTPFDFTPENYELVKKIIAKYPPGYAKSATIPLLDLAQRQCEGWVPLAAMHKVCFHFFFIFYFLKKNRNIISNYFNFYYLLFLYFFIYYYFFVYNDNNIIIIMFLYFFISLF